MTDLPRLATSSYSAYRSDMGTPVRISLGTPKWISLPDPRYGSREHWLYLTEATPQGWYLRKAREKYEPLYLAQLDKHADAIEEKLRWIPVEHGRLVLLCFEKNTALPEEWCHRRFFADWWQQRTGQEVPELGGKRGC